MNTITIKGNKDGLTVFVNSGTYEEIKSELSSRIDRARDFFSGSKLTIVDNQSRLAKENYADLQMTLRKEYNIDLLYGYNEIKVEKNEKIFTGIYEGRTKFIKNTVRSGQKICFNGNVVVIGDVNSGAEVVATGNIVVMGVLRGVAHAGSNGNKRAFVCSYMLQPSQLRIADIISRSPDDYKGKPKTPEIAKIKDNLIVIEPYLPNKYF